MSFLDVLRGEITTARTLRPLVLTALVFVAIIVAYCVADSPTGDR